MPDYTPEDIEILSNGSWTDKDGTVFPFLTQNRYGEDVPSIEGVAFAIIDAIPEVKKFSADALDKHGRHSEQICQDVFGEVTPALLEYINNQIGVGANGAVQRRLSTKKLVLCSGRVRRNFTFTDDDGNESDREQVVAVRVVSKDKTTVQALYLDPTIARRERQGEKERADAAMVAVRVPGLKTYVDNEYPKAVIAGYQRGWGRELISGNGEATQDEEEGADDTVDTNGDES